MEFIKASEFLKQPEEVQEVLTTWFVENISDFDLVQVGEGAMLYGELVKREWYLGNSFYPLFTEGQLRKFIEDKTNHIMFLDFEIIDGKLDYDIYLFNEKDIYVKYEHLGENLLQAYWKAACEIAEESVENEI